MPEEQDFVVGYSLLSDNHLLRPVDDEVSSLVIGAFVEGDNLLSVAAMQSTPFRPHHDGDVGYGNFVQDLLTNFLAFFAAVWQSFGDVLGDDDVGFELGLVV